MIEQVHTGAMICVRIPKDIADQLSVVGGEPPERMHMTLVYLGDALGLSAEDDERIAELLTEVGESYQKIKAELSGIGRFENAETGSDAVVALVDAPGLDKLRAHLVHELEEAGIPVSRNHGFTPHITLAYIGYHEQLPIQRIGGLDMRISALEYVQGDVKIVRTPLRGKKVEKALTQDLDVSKSVVRRGGEYCVVSDDGTEFGCYDTEREAEERLAEVHTFSTLEPRTAEPGQYEVQMRFPISKADIEQRLVYGIVLEPDEVDAQNDTINEAGIQKTAHNFLSKYNRESEMGHMHRRLGDIGVELVESYIAPMDFTIGQESVKKGSWLIATKVVDDALWADVKSGKLTGFSVAGIATIVDG